MLPFVTAGAQGDHVRVVIVALLAAELLGVDLQVLSGTTDLTLPAPLSSLPDGISRKRGALSRNSLQEAFSVTSSTKVYRSK